MTRSLGFRAVQLVFIRNLMELLILNFDNERN